LVWWWVAPPLCRRIIAATTATATAIVGTTTTTLSTPTWVRVAIAIRRRLFLRRVDCRWRRPATLTLGTHFWRHVLHLFIFIWRWWWWFMLRTWQRLALWRWLLVH
jgi:hypothetical protein